MAPRGVTGALWSSLLVLFLAAQCAADAINIVRIELTETEPGRYVLETDVPPMLSARAPRFEAPPRFTFEQRPEIIRIQDRSKMRAVFACSEQPLTPADELFAPWPLDGAFVVARWRDGSIRTGYMPGDRVSGIVIDMAMLLSVTPTTRELVQEKLGAGVRHALTMPVHLVLVITVVLCARGRGGLKLLLALTAGQAISMVLVDVSGSQLPATAVEACLAIAAVMLARAGLRGENRSMASGYLAILLLLGVLHGLAVAGQLRAADIHGIYRVQALFAYGIGVDLVHYGLALAGIALLSIKADSAVMASSRVMARYGAGAVAIALIAFMYLDNPPPVTSNQAIGPLEQFGGQPNKQQSRRPVVQSTRQGLQYPCMSFIAIEPFEVRHEALFQLDAIMSMTGWESAQREWIELDEQPDLIRHVLEVVARRCVVRIGGEDLEPAVRHAAFAEVTGKGTLLRGEPLREKRNEAVLAVTLAYRTDGLPSSVAVEWGLFSDQVSGVPLTITDPINVERARLTADAPAREWVNKLHGFPLPTVEAVALIKPRLPIVSALAITAVAVVAARRRWTRGRAATPLIAAILVLATLSYPFVRPAMAVPMLGQPRPSPDQAAEVLEQLLENIYRAFDHREEEAVFDRLALTVSGEALTDIYLQNRRMLELENRGGARVRVTEVKIDKVNSVTAQSAGRFVVNAAWMVSGSVTHFGHTHFRTNAYLANVSLAADGSVWKLTAINILDERRTR